MYITCNGTSVIMMNFRKSKTHATTDTYLLYMPRPARTPKTETFHKESDSDFRGLIFRPVVGLPSQSFRKDYCRSCLRTFALFTKLTKVIRVRKCVAVYVQQHFRKLQLAWLLGGINARCVSDYFQFSKRLVCLVTHSPTHL